MIGKKLRYDIDLVGGNIPCCDQEVKQDRKGIGRLLFVSEGV